MTPEEVSATARRVLGDENADQWLDNRGIPYFNKGWPGKTPRELLVTEEGCRQVTLVLLAIEGGVYL